MAHETLTKWFSDTPNSALRGLKSHGGSAWCAAEARFRTDQLTRRAGELGRAQFVHPTVVRRCELDCEIGEARCGACESAHCLDVVCRLQVVAEPTTYVRERVRPNVDRGLQLQHDPVGEAVGARLPALAVFVGPVNR